jgi:protoheme IX farnesyltransferase
MVLFTVLMGVILASPQGVNMPLLIHTVLGTALVAGSACTLNNFLERRLDSLMRRTHNRPLPAGRRHPVEALALGVGLGLVGILYLLAALPEPWAALVAAATLICYVGLYTPLKQRTSLNTLVGAIPGALPPLIGWTAVRHSLQLEALGLFLIIFFWQVPHFLAIAWLHREDYARAGFRMLPAMDRGGLRTGRYMVLYCLALIPASWLPALAGELGTTYLAGALVLGISFFLCALGFLRSPSTTRARRVLRGSLFYLPVLLVLMFATILVHRM